MTVSGKEKHRLDLESSR